MAKWGGLMIAVWLGCFPLIAAGELEQRRVSLGLKLFPALLAADRDIATKVTGDGSLHLIVLFIDDERGAQALATSLEKVGTIRKIPIKASAVRFAELENLTDVIGGLFMAEQPREDLDRVLTIARNRKVVVFSPFEGDVERGVMGGIMVNARILPYLNMPAVQASDIRIKSFFLRIAAQYE